MKKFPLKTEVLNTTLVLQGISLLPYSFLQTKGRSQFYTTKLFMEKTTTVLNYLIYVQMCQRILSTQTFLPW